MKSNVQLTDTDYEEIMMHLDDECWQCKGSGTFIQNGALTMDCDIYYGTGYQCTGAGIQLLGFLRRQRKRVEREGV